jgi:multidrug resistance efflux pump
LLSHSFWEACKNTAETIRLAGNVVLLTTRVNGTVTAIRADNTQRIQEDQTPMLLDSTDARIIHDDTVTVLPAEVKGSSPATGTIPRPRSAKNNRHGQT